jgi:hypothetical protein
MATTELELGKVYYRFDKDGAGNMKAVHRFEVKRVSPNEDGTKSYMLVDKDNCFVEFVNSADRPAMSKLLSEGELFDVVQQAMSGWYSEYQEEWYK